VDEVRDDDQRIKLTTKKFSMPILHTQPTKSKIGDRQYMYFRKKQVLTEADLLCWLTIF
jgi:hypothetical protein